MQVYIALIGTLLIAIETGARPSSYDFALMSMAVAGLAPLEQVLAQTAKRPAERRPAAERQRPAERKKQPLTAHGAARAGLGGWGMRPALPALRPGHKRWPPNQRPKPSLTL